MGIFRRGKAESRAVDTSAFLTDSDWWRTTRVDPIRLVPVYSAVSLLADSVASLPLQAFRARPDGTRERASTPRLFTDPASEGTLYDWVHQAMTSLLLRGNAYGLVTAVGADGWPTSMEWLDPARVGVTGRPGAVDYTYTGRPLDRGSVVHIRAFSMPGALKGLSPLEQFATTFEMGLSAESSARDWYANGVTPAHSLQNSERTIPQSVAMDAKAAYRAAVRSGDVFVHGKDWNLSTLGVSAGEAQFLEGIKATATQVAAIYRVAPEDIGGDTGSSMTYSTTEMQDIRFLTRSLRPWLVRLEQSFSRLVPRPVYMRFNADAMIRTDLKSRWQVHQIATGIGAVTVNEVRAVEDRPPVEWGDEPMSMQADLPEVGDKPEEG